MLGEFFADWQPLDPAGRGTLAAGLVTGPLDGGGNPSMRSYTHLVEAGHSCPTGPSNPPRNAKR